MKKISLKNWGLALGSVTLVVLLLEVGLRLFAPLYTAVSIDAYQYDEQLGVSLKPDLHFLRSVDYQEEIRTNRMGAVNFQQSFSDYETVVFAIGDSYTQGVGVPSDAAYPFQLDLLLNMRSGVYKKQYGVVNLGIGGYGLEQTLLSLNRYAERIGVPAYVLFLGAANDYVDDQRFRSGYRHRHLVDGSPYWGVLLKPLQWVRHDTELGKRLRVARTLLAHKKKSRRKRARPANTQPNIAQLQEPTLARLVERCHRLGASLLVAWKDIPQWDDGSYGWLQAWAEKQPGVLFVEWHQRAVSVLDAIPGLPTSNPHSGRHYRTWVNHVLAAAFAEALMDLDRGEEAVHTAIEARSCGTRKSMTGPLGTMPSGLQSGLGGRG